MYNIYRELRICMAAIGMLLSAALDSYPVMSASVLFCLLVLLFDLFRLFVEGFCGRYFLFSSLSCGIWVSFGFLLSFFQIDHGQLLDFNSLFTASTVTITSTSYSLATCYLMFFIACSSAVSRLTAIRQAEYKFQFIVLKQLALSSRFHSNIVLLFVSLFGLIISAQNLVVVRGLSEDFKSDQGSLPWWYPLTLTLLSLFPVLIACCIKYDFRLASFRGFLVSMATIIGLYFAALQSRSSLLGFFIIVPLVWLLLFRPLFKLTPKIFAFSLLIILLLSFLFPLFSIFFAFINYARTFRGVSIDPAQFLSLFTDFLSDSVFVADASARSAENLSSRPLVLWPLAASISMAINGLNSDYLYFQDLLNSFLNSLPRFIYPFKAELLLQENLLYSYFPFSTVDTADSPYLYSFASFGILGLFVYPLFIGLLYWSFLQIASISINKSTGVFSFFSSALAFSTVSTFAVRSYGESSTSSLIRLFIVPAAVLIALSIIAAPFRTYSRAWNGN